VKNLLQQFARVFLVCWLILIALILVLLLALGIHGETVDFARLNTWAALGLAMLFAACWAIPPGLFLATLFSAVIYWRGHKQVLVAARTPQPIGAATRAGPKA
jgi:uncharacterized BrkB/YihY/UPF0761 family membrane protein